MENSLGSIWARLCYESIYIVAFEQLTRPLMTHARRHMLLFLTGALLFVGNIARFDCGNDRLLVRGDRTDLRGWHLSNR